MADLTSRQMKARVHTLAAQIKHLRNKASSTEFPAECDTLIRVADQQLVKMVALQTELAREVRAPSRNPLLVLSDVQCHALLLAERGFPRAWKRQIGKRTWSSLVRKKYIAFPKGSDRIVATEKGKAFLMALRKENAQLMFTLVTRHLDDVLFLTTHQWALSSVLHRELDRLHQYHPTLWTNARIVKVL